MSRNCSRSGGPIVHWGKHFHFHRVVFPLASALIVALVVISLSLPRATAMETFAGVRDWIGDAFGWLYLFLLNGLLALAAYLALGPYGSIRLGEEDDRPEFGRLSWFAMLFSAGMGIGLLFWSVAEPIEHLVNPPPGRSAGVQPARLAMATTIFHWALHPWALYAIVGLSLAYFSFRKQLPLSFRSLLHPLLGDRVNGWVGHWVDTLAIVATLLGVATSLGIGAQQVNAGLAFLFGMPLGIGVQVALIGGITGVATISVMLGLGTGIRRLSELNIGLAMLLMLMVIAAAGLSSYMRGVSDNIGAYLQYLPSSSFRAGAFSREGSRWLNSWTVFYWAWWISWSPFVGMFIARVSRGRTIREFVIGVLLMPTAVGILWLTAFGNTTLDEHRRHVQTIEDGQNDASRLPVYHVAVLDESGSVKRNDEGQLLSQQKSLTTVQYMDATIISQDGDSILPTLPTALFAMLSGLFTSSWVGPLAIGIATTCVMLFFVTSSDSASMVIDIIASGGNPNPPLGTRLFWAITEGVVAATLLVAGGLSALQAASITAALPMTFIVILACIGLLRELRNEAKSQQAS
ncbi:Glycine betaine transporter OpuD [Rubripirellula obstinata]|uniref:Glycine betaine transporter OpuD n=1 Tax=Rubripirellula obstinata TaxID=406547 RepID=A0A5B1CGR5_9BACT|nr:BCCT family transporter [Rubripirellula obstinata]KAA1258394.1 Glycine betaine transporter OpuD [Rubripirellula obstinata]